MTTGKAILILILAGFVIYFNSLLNGFVWDDEEQVLNNSFVHSIANIPSLFLGSTFNTGGSGSLAGMYYKPMMTSFYALIYSVFGQSAFFFHFFQVLLHIINACLVFLLFKKFFSKEISFFASLVFLVHPINTEAVAYISALQDVLFFFFGMTALIYSQREKLKTKQISILAALLLFSLLSKETGVVFLILVPLFSYFFQKKNLKIYTICSFLVFAGYLILRIFVARVLLGKDGPSPIMQAPQIERLMSIPQIVFFYIKTFFYPKDLSIAQHWVVRSVDTNSFFVPLIVLAVVLIFILVIGWMIWKSKKSLFAIYCFFCLWTIFGLGLHLQIFPLDMTVAERWFYLASVGVVGLFATAASAINFKNRAFKLTAIVVVVSISLALGARTVYRNFDWKDGLTLFKKDIALNSGSFDLQNNLGVELFRNGQLDQAEIHFKKSTELAPNWWTNWSNLGVIFERKKNYTLAKQYYQKATLNGEYYLAFENLANLLLFQESPDEAKEFIEGALQKLPQNSKLWLSLALAEYKLDNHDKALDAARRSFKLQPTKQSYYVISKLEQNQKLEF